MKRTGKLQQTQITSIEIEQNYDILILHIAVNLKPLPVGEEKLKFVAGGSWKQWRYWAAVRKAVEDWECGDRGQFL